jgi:predicted dehydrogenase
VREVGIGIVGYGIMGKAHSYAYHAAPRIRELPVRPRLRLMSGRNAEAVSAAARTYGVEETTGDWRALVEHPGVDIVDGCTPPGTHAEIVAAAAAAAPRFDHPRLNELLYGDAGDEEDLYGMRVIRAEHDSHPYAAQWWPIGQGVGYDASFVNQAADLLERWPGGGWDPDLETGLRVQAVCAAMERSAADRRWVGVSEIAAETV